MAGLAVFLLAVLAFGVITALWVWKTPLENLRAFGELVLGRTFVNTGDGQTPAVAVSRGTRLVSFWTPSAKTGSSLMTQGKIPSEEEWEIVTDDFVDQFEVKLWKRFHKDPDSGLTGLRRFEVHGIGRSHFKQGWWWIMTVDKQFTTDEFVKFYFDNWHSSKSVYVEELETSGAYQKDTSGL